MGVKACEWATKLSQRQADVEGRLQAKARPGPSIGEKDGHSIISVEQANIVSIEIEVEVVARSVRSTAHL